MTAGLIDPTSKTRVIKWQWYWWNWKTLKKQTIISDRITIIVSKNGKILWNYYIKDR
jgi:hypothetical protein